MFFNVFPLAGHNELFWDTKLLGKGMLVMAKCFFFMQCCVKAIGEVGMWIIHVCDMHGFIE